MYMGLPGGVILRNQYVIEQIIGYGSMGYVYRCEDIFSKEKVAIKEAFAVGCIRIGAEVLAMENSVKEIGQDTVNAGTNQPSSIMLQKQQNSLSGNAYFSLVKDMVREEAAMLQKLGSQPYMTRVFDIFEENNTVYMVMELIDGESLRWILDRVRIIDEELVRKTGIILAQPLKFLHGLGLLHCDICPQNIMMGSSLKLIDYGTVDSFSEKRSNVKTYRKAYSPPEQYDKNGLIGPYTDIYSMGAVLYEMLTGKRLQCSLDRLEHDLVIPPCDLSPNASYEMSRVIMKAIELNPEKRYQSAGEFETALVRDDKSLYQIKRTIQKAIIMDSAALALYLVSVL